MRAQAGVETEEEREREREFAGKRKIRKDRLCGGRQVSQTAQCVGQ